MYCWIANGQHATVLHCEFNHNISITLQCHRFFDILFIIIWHKLPTTTTITITTQMYYNHHRLLVGGFTLNGNLLSWEWCLIGGWKKNTMRPLINFYSKMQISDQSLNHPANLLSIKICSWMLKRLLVLVRQPEPETRCLSVLI